MNVQLQYRIIVMIMIMIIMALTSSIGMPLMEIMALAREGGFGVGVVGGGNVLAISRKIDR